MLVVSVRVNPTSSAVDFKWAPIEHFRKTSTHVNFGGRGQSIWCGFRGRGCTFLGRCPFSSPRGCLRWGASILSVRPCFMCSTVWQGTVSSTWRTLGDVEVIQGSSCGQLRALQRRRVSSCLWERNFKYWFLIYWRSLTLLINYLRSRRPSSWWQIRSWLRGLWLLTRTY